MKTSVAFCLSFASDDLFRAQRREIFPLYISSSKKFCKGLAIYYVLRVLYLGCSKHEDNFKFSEQLQVDAYYDPNIDCHTALEFQINFDVSPGLRLKIT